MQLSISRDHAWADILTVVSESWGVLCHSFHVGSLTHKQVVSSKKSA